MTVCKTVPAWHELRAAAPSPLDCNIQSDSKSFEKSINKTNYTVTVCITADCPAHLIRLTVEPLWFSVVPESSILVISLVVLVTSWYLVFGGRLYKRWLGVL